VKQEAGQYPREAACTRFKGLQAKVQQLEEEKESMKAILAFTQAEVKELRTKSKQQ